MEVIAGFSPNTAEEFGLVVQGTDTITYNRPTGKLSRTPFSFGTGEELVLRVYVDRSVTEIFANDRLYQSMRTYHQPTDDLGLRIFARGGEVEVKSVDVWEMKPIEITEWSGGSNQ